MVPHTCADPATVTSKLTTRSDPTAELCHTYDEAPLNDGNSVGLDVGSVLLLDVGGNDGTALIMGLPEGQND